MTRPHHYNFGHVALRDFAFLDPTKMFVYLASEHAQEFLLRLWEFVYEQIPEGERLSPGELKYSLHPFSDGSHIAVITLPAPEVMTEAAFVGIAFAPLKKRFLRAPKIPSIRFLTLERTEDNDGKEAYLLCEWAVGREGWLHGNFDEQLDKLTESQFARLVRETVRIGAEPSVALGIPLGGSK
jgi:hypothetical protein